MAYAVSVTLRNVKYLLSDEGVYGSLICTRQDGVLRDVDLLAWAKRSLNASTP